ncbi:MAG: RHS repeat-associated core domain-containing protein [Planctomycetes bacterium]|nr:RHS repeat-associated core domain-containing protein [Planctomycetota bacterium]
MARLNSYALVYRYGVLAALLAMVAPQRPAWADPILEIYNDSLTTYLPTSKSNIQDIRALVDQRGVNIDGSLRTAAGPPMALAGNPFSEPWNESMILSGVRLDTGTVSITDVDLALPAPSFSWVIGRSYNARQHDGTAYFDSNGYQGKNWFQLSQPEIVLYDDADDTKDMVYVVYGADRYIAFKRKNATSDQFKAVNGVAGVVEFLDGYEDGPVDVYIYTDQRGWQYFFFGFDANYFPVSAKGQFWKVVAPGPGIDGYVAYLGLDVDAYNSAIAAYYETDGRIGKVFDTAGRRYTYSYDNNNRLIEVLAEMNETGFPDVAKVEYDYYGDFGQTQLVEDQFGSPGDLRMVRITEFQTEDDVTVTRVKYYRYYDSGPYDVNGHRGNAHQIQYIFEFEGTRRFDWDQDAELENWPSVLPEYMTETDETVLKPYASAYFEYEDDDEANGEHRRIIKAWFNGACGCSGAANGTHEYEYQENGSFPDPPSSGYDTAWKSRTIVKRPDGSYITQYFDEVGQPLSRVLTDGDPNVGSPQTWATYVVRDESGTEGFITKIHSPANITGYTHSTGSFATSTTDGLVTVFTRVATGDMKGFVEDRKHQKGAGNAYLDVTSGYTSATKIVGDVTLVRPLISYTWEYTEETTVEAGPTSGPTGAHQVKVDYDSFHSGVGVLTPNEVTVTHPAVSIDNHGSGSVTTSKGYFNEEAKIVFEKMTDGTINYRQYGDDGKPEKTIVDADTASTEITDCAPTVPPSFQSSGAPLHLVTCLTYKGGGSMAMGGGPPDPCDCDNDAEGDSSQTGDGPMNITYKSKLKDGRTVTLGFSDWEEVLFANDKYYGPVTYTVSNHSGQVELQGVIALADNGGEYTLADVAIFVDEADGDPLTAIDGIGTVTQATTFVYDQSGQRLEESRLYFAIPLSGEGIEGSEYDATLYGYDDMGRSIRVKDATGTIRRIVYDKLGRVTEQRIGTNDFSFSGGEPAGPDNMVKTVAKVYDSGNDGGNSYLTQQTLFVEDGAPGQRVTTYTNDLRGRVIVTVGPEPPFVVGRYDNLGRVIATGDYSSSTGLDEDTDPTLTTSANRVGLTETLFDEMGGVYKGIRWKINQANGNKDDSLETLNWYDAMRRVIKIDGSHLTKTSYDRLSRPTHQFILASDNDTGYGDADDVAGDIVLQETQTVYESSNSDDVVMTAVIDRFHDDYGAGESTGALDTNADNDDLKYTATNITGRIQIIANWYDRFERLTDTVRYGMYDPDDDGDFDTFDRSGLSTPPARTDPIIQDGKALLSEYEFYADGTLKSVTDPEDLETRFEYDAAARQTKVINNYFDGTPIVATDQTIKYEYTDGLRTKMIADLPAGETDQQTIYTFGTTKGVSAGDSKIATGHLLQKVQYPDSSGGTDVVTFAYNAQVQQIWTKDQEGNVTETDYDHAGRQTHRRITGLATGFDGAIRRISTTYDNLGRRQLVAQHDKATVGSGTIVDEVKFTYEDWGNVSKFEQDHNSAIGGSLLYDVAYTYEKATNGRNTIRRTGITMPDGNVLTYQFRANDLHDEEASRVTMIQEGPTYRVRYHYNGVGQVVGTQYLEPLVIWNQFGSSGSYPDLDRFNRITSSRWTKDLATDVDFYDVDITYDRNSNITLIQDNVHAGFDVDYTIDNLNRLTQAEEGTWNSGTSQIDSTTRDQIWTTLNQTGNWDLVKLDLNGDGVFTGADEYNDDRTHNDVNELTARDTDDDGTDDFTLTSDKLGNLTDDGEHWKYTYDAFGRLRKIDKIVSGLNPLVAEYTYNGLGHRIGWHYDVDANGTVKGDDPWYRFVYDERWRIVATFRASDSSPKEQFVYHNAGLDGFGGSSYIDTVVLRDKDANTAWSTASDGTLEERIYYCHNWRGDVVALIDDTADQVEQVRYSSYGVPFGLPKGDTDGDGDLDTTDVNQIRTWVNSAQYDVRGDLDLDGDVDGTDHTNATNASPVTLGWGVLSDVGNRKGYAGYELDDAIAGNYRLYHVRNRVLNSDLGRWLTRDPLGYVDGANLYEYVGSNPLGAVDPMGTIPPEGPFGTGIGGGPGRRPFPRNPRPPPGAGLCVAVPMPGPARRPIPANPRPAPGSGLLYATPFDTTADTGGPLTPGSTPEEWRDFGQYLLGVLQGYFEEPDPGIQGPGGLHEWVSPAGGAIKGCLAAAKFFGRAKKIRDIDYIVRKYRITDRAMRRRIHDEAQRRKLGRRSLSREELEEIVRDLYPHLVE